VAAADTPDRLDPGALGRGSRRAGTGAQFVEPAQRKRRHRPPDADGAVELAARDLLEQVLRDRAIGCGRSRNRSGSDEYVQRQRSLSSTLI
jgi:hypothetical protein